MAKRCGVSKKALELYQRHGLLTPLQTDPWTGYRYYSVKQCNTVETIRGLQAVGFTLSEIGGILHRQDDMYLRRALEKKLAELEANMAALTQAMSKAQDMLARC